MDPKHSLRVCRFPEITVRQLGTTLSTVYSAPERGQEAGQQQPVTAPDRSPPPPPPPVYTRAPSHMALVRAPTAWTILQQDGPNHLGLWYNVIPEHQIDLITLVCVPCSAPSWRRPARS